MLGTTTAFRALGASLAALCFARVASSQGASSPAFSAWPFTPLLSVTLLRTSPHPSPIPEIIRTEVEGSSGERDGDTGTERLYPLPLASSLHQDPPLLHGRAHRVGGNTHESRAVARLGGGLLVRLVRQTAGGRGEEAAGRDGGHFRGILYNRQFGRLGG